jgi:hypothetical protein
MHLLCDEFASMLSLSVFFIFFALKRHFPAFGFATGTLGIDVVQSATGGNAHGS